MTSKTETLSPEVAQVVHDIDLIVNEISALYVDREPLIRAVALAIVCRQHILSIGPGGTAKSEVIEEFARRIEGANFFIYQLDGNTHPNEIFGGLSLEALRRRDTQERNTKGYLPEAHVAVIDEVFSGNSVVRNGLRRIMNEREFFDSGRTINCPLITVMGATNTVPEDTEDTFYDRWLIRVPVSYLSDSIKINKMLKGSQRKPKDTKVTLSDLALVQAAVKDVMIPDEIRSRFIHLLSEIKESSSDTGSKVISDRRLVQTAGQSGKGRPTASLIKGAAVLSGRGYAELDDLMVGQHTLWSNPVNAENVRNILMRTVQPMDAELSKIFDEIAKIFTKHLHTPDVSLITTAERGAITKCLRAAAEIADKLKGKPVDSRAMVTNKTLGSILSAGSRLATIMEKDPAAKEMVKEMNAHCERISAAATRK